MKDGDAEEVKEILTVVSEKIPALLNSLADVLYGREQAKKYGEAVAGFYKTLKDSGMTDEQAFDLTQKYMSAMNLGDLIGQAAGAKGRKRIEREIGRDVREGQDEEGGGNEE